MKRSSEETSRIAIAVLSVLLIMNRCCYCVFFCFVAVTGIICVDILIIAIAMKRS